MDDETLSEQRSLVSASDRGLTSRPSSLARRGLDLLGTCCDGEIKDAVLTHRKGTCVKELYFWRRQVAAPCLRHLAELTTLERLELSGGGGTDAVTDAGMVHLAELKSLRYLDLSHNRALTDEGLAQLAGLTGLEELVLKATHVTDSGLAYLRGLTALRKLNLSFTEVSDAGLVHLAGLTHLHELGLACQRVTDDRLPYLVPHLRRLTSLELLLLHPDRTSEAAIVTLRAALPGCRIWVQLL